MRFCFKNRTVEITERPALMGIVNVTPDSFSDGGKFFDTEAAVRHGLELYADGAAVIDIGGESTRPGAPEVREEEEIRRIIPVIAAMKQQRPEIILSVDTRKAAVAAAAVDAGAEIINDVSGLEYSPEIAALAAQRRTGLIIMHMQGNPETMQHPEFLLYEDVVNEVAGFLAAAAQKALDYGVKRENIILDPGIGFAKTAEQNLALLRNISRIRAGGYPVMVGPSRKAFIGRLLGRDNAGDRLAGTVGAALCLAAQGVEILRVHDVREIADAMKMFNLCAPAQGVKI
ncbi:MAG: dihydropteroate synthase [Victivallaceae bacterium]|nr:dihydropteroate synthase [Victivallaceae bacterium]